MTTRTKLVVAVVIAFVAFLAFGIYRAGLDEVPAPPNDTDITASHGGTITGHRIKYRSWTADYERLVANADQSVVDIYGVHHGIVYRAGKPYLAVRAQHLTVNTVTHDFNATGPLSVTTLRGTPRSFTTDAVNWSDATQRLTFPRPTAISTAGGRTLTVGSLAFNVRHGTIDATLVRGAVKFK